MTRPGHPGFRVALVGAESTGKTTLARQIAERLGAPWVGEFAREYATRMARPLEARDVEPIARGQMDLEDRALASAPSVLVLDTDLVSTVVYARHYYGACPDWVVAEAGRRASNLYLLLTADLQFDPDPVRDSAEARAAIEELFRAQLRAFSATTADVSGSGAQRLENALRAIARHRPDLVGSHA